MDKLLFLLPLLACPVMMGAMMWMMRGSHTPASDTTAEEIARLRAEVDRLQNERSGTEVTARPQPLR